MRVAAIKQDAGYPRPMSNRIADFVNHREIHADQIKADNRDTLIAVIENQGPGK
jgi:hypothetical protein